VRKVQDRGVETEEDILAVSSLTTFMVSNGMPCTECRPYMCTRQQCAVIGWSTTEGKSARCQPVWHPVTNRLHPVCGHLFSHARRTVS
jgi:hypothetical protein